MVEGLDMYIYIFSPFEKLKGSKFPKAHNILYIILTKEDKICGRGVWEKTMKKINKTLKNTSGGINKKPEIIIQYWIGENIKIEMRKYTKYILFLFFWGGPL